MPAAPNIEHHPLQPFLPKDARLLMLGSFPPPKERWCMDFFYPNPQTDIAALLQQLPQCHDICCTGGKAAETLAEMLHTSAPTLSRRTKKPQHISTCSLKQE